VSLRSRLLLALGVGLVLALLVAGVATYRELRTFLLAQVDHGLQTSVMTIRGHGPDGAGGAPGPGGPGGPANQGAANDQFASSEGGSGECNLPRLDPQTYLQVRSSSGPVCADLAYQAGPQTTCSPRLPAEITGFSAANSPGGDPTVYFNAPSEQTGGPEFRVLATELSGGQQLVLAVPLSATYATLHHLLLIELAVAAAALVLAGLVGTWLVHVGFRPLRDIERTAGAIADGDLSHRVPGPNGKTEVGRLAIALNVMLGRIQQAFAARDATEAALRQSEGRLRQFVADASHELRTPVAAVSAYAELFERGADSRPQDLARVMHGIRNETSRMGHLVEDLLLLARLDESRPLERSPVDLGDIARHAVEAAQAVGPQWQLRVDASEPVMVSGDASRLRQVLDNLLANVRAHTPPGSTAAVAVSRAGDQAIVEVSDNGPGISADDAARLFERFYRADASRSRASGGAGLGLSIVAAIVAAHGGTVAAAPVPAPGHGAVFTVRVPAAGEDATASAPAARVDPTAGGSGREDPAGDHRPGPPAGTGPPPAGAG
jgi:two-component system OmpR family sensor kinase